MCSLLYNSIVIMGMRATRCILLRNAVEVEVVTLFAPQDETGIYKNLLQETAHRAGLKLPVYTTIRSGPGHTPVFTCTVELAGKTFTGNPGKTKKQAQKNAAMAAWSELKQCEYLYQPQFVDA
jgi:dsRNA-specific ribonuclease